MQTGLTLPDLARKLVEDKQQKKDMIVSTKALRLVEPTSGNLELEVPGHGLYPLEPLAHQQVAAHTGIPAKYYQRMQADTPSLLVDNVNTWFQREPSLRMLRTMRQRGRAFLSNRYQRIENDVIAEVALNVLADRNIEVISANVTDSRLYIQAVVPALQGEVKGSRQVGDFVQGGVVISNSEVGLGRVEIRELDYRLVCTNGMVGASLFKKTHLGAALDDDEALWADDTRRVSDDALMLKVRDMIAEAAKPERFQQRINRMSDLTKLEIEGDPHEAVQVLGSVLGLSDEEESSILKSLIRGGDASAWGMLNALTFQANTATDYDRAVELEQAGGKLLELPRNQWKRILEPELAKAA